MIFLLIFPVLINSHQDLLIHLINLIHPFHPIHLIPNLNHHLFALIQMVIHFYSIISYVIIWKLYDFIIFLVKMIIFIKAFIFFHLSIKVVIMAFVIRMTTTKVAKNFSLRTIILIFHFTTFLFLIILTLRNRPFTLFFIRL